MEEICEKTRRIALEANWNWLPAEIKMECIKEMDFKSRLNVKLSSKTEKSLVNAMRSKYRFNYVRIFAKSTRPVGNRYSRWTGKHVQKELLLIANSEQFGTELRFRSTNISEAIEKIMSILKCSKIHTLELKIIGFDAHVELHPLVAALDAHHGALSISTLKMALKKDNDVEFAVLQKCDASLKKIVVSHVQVKHQRGFDVFKTIPQVVAVPIIEFSKEIEQQVLHNVVVTLFLQRILNQADFPVGGVIRVERGEMLFRQFVGKLPEGFVIHRRPAHNALCIATKNHQKRVWTWHSASDGHVYFTVVARPSGDPDFEGIGGARDAEKRDEERISERIRTLDTKNGKCRPAARRYNPIDSIIYRMFNNFH